MMAADAPPVGEMVVLGDGSADGGDPRDPRYPYPRSPPRGVKNSASRNGDEGASSAAKLERALEDASRAEIAQRELSSLRRNADATRRDDYASNAMLRRAARASRRERAALNARRDALGLPSSISLLPVERTDMLTAAAVRFGTGANQRVRERAPPPAGLPSLRVRPARGKPSRVPRLPAGVHLGLSDPGGHKR